MLIFSSQYKCRYLRIFHLTIMIISCNSIQLSDLDIYNSFASMIQDEIHVRCVVQLYVKPTSFKKRLYLKLFCRVLLPQFRGNRQMSKKKIQNFFWYTKIKSNSYHILDDILKKKFLLIASPAVTKQFNLNIFFVLIYVYFCTQYFINGLFQNVLYLIN